MTIIEDRERLVAALRARGVDYLAPRDAAGAPVDDESLVASLAAHDDPRLRQALCALFMVQPGLAPLAPRLVETLPRAAAVELTAQYMAAVYLREMWGIRLERYCPGLSGLPDFFSQRLGLPPPVEGHGKVGLHALAGWQAQQSGVRANHLSEYEHTAELMLAQLKLAWRHELALTR
jgi:hypothetical protein